MPLPTASHLDTALACLGSTVLEGVSSTGRYAEAGTVLHRYLDTARKQDRAAALTEAPDDEREWLASLDLDALPAGAESEVALGWSPIDDTAVRYDLAQHRGYPADGRMHGTADLVGVVDHVGDDRIVVVLDVKRYGAKVRAKDSAQLAFGALAAARLSGAEGARVGMVVPGSRGWRVDSAELDALDLEEWADRFRDLARRIEGYRPGTLPPLATGPHCTYCPVLRWCPAQSAIVRQMSGIDLATMDARVAALSDGEAGEFWEQAGLLEKIVEAAKDSLRARARQVPIPLSGGRELREVRWTATVKSDVAKGELAALGKDLEQRGEISKVPTPQVRAVAARSQ